MRLFKLTALPKAFTLSTALTVAALNLTGCRGLGYGYNYNPYVPYNPNSGYGGYYNRSGYVGGYGTGPSMEWHHLFGGTGVWLPGGGSHNHGGGFGGGHSGGRGRHGFNDITPDKYLNLQQPPILLSGNYTVKNPAPV